VRLGVANLETMVAATLEATLLNADAEGEAQFRLTMDTLSRYAYDAYRSLVYGTPRFNEYFRAATPISELAELNIGSRPASRKASKPHRGPARHPVGSSAGRRAGCFCLGGTASARRWAVLLESQGKGALAELCRMYRGWPFFRTLIENLEMVLAKTDLGDRVAVRRARRRP